MTDHFSVPSAAHFSDLGLPPHLLEAVTALGFDTPTDIQAAAIPALLAGEDIVGVAQTGTGKTAAFGLPLLASIDPELPVTQGLILAPTRELALQVATALESFAGHGPGRARVAAVYGGAPYGPQKKALAAGAQVVVGTPGRVIDHLEKGYMSLADLRFMVLDEGDEMLRMGFAEEVDTILARAPKQRQTALFSATMPPAIRATAERHLHHPRQITVSRQSSTVEGVVQRYAVVPFRHKVAALARLLATTEAEATIVFVRTRAAAEEVGGALTERGFNAATISGDVAQTERERLVQRLRRGQLDVLVATDVAARGLDVDRVGLVVNFDLPHDGEGYVHRIGRTGRAGRTGTAFTFVNPSERRRLRTIEKTIQSELIEHPIPTAAEVAGHKLTAVLERVPQQLAAGGLAQARKQVLAAVADGADPVEVAACLAAMAAGITGVSGHQEEDLALDRELSHAFGRGAEREPHRDRRDSSNRSARRGGLEGGERYWIGVGRGHGAHAGAIVGAITNEGKLRKMDLGRIEIFNRFSIVEIRSELSVDTLRRLSRTRVAGQALRIRPDGAGRGVRRPQTRHS